MKIQQTILEALVFLAVVCVVAFTVNAQRSDGLDLGRNYFGTRQGPPEPSAPAPPAKRPVENHGQAGTHMADHGFQTVSLEEAFEYYERGDTSILFVDARDDAHFEQCRVPNAVQFDYYRPDDYVDKVIAFAEEAEVVILYCNGGTCEDSLLAAQYLTSEIDSPIDFDKVYVFEGGIQNWTTAGLPRHPENCQP